jgi:proteic killer suppression protein
VTYLPVPALCGFPRWKARFKVYAGIFLMTKIKSFGHKGLEAFFYEGTTKGIQAKHTDKLRYRLDRLNSAGDINDMDFPGYDFHQLKGRFKGIWSVKVFGNWRRHERTDKAGV